MSTSTRSKSDQIPHSTWILLSDILDLAQKSTWLQFFPFYGPRNEYKKLHNSCNIEKGELIGLLLQSKIIFFHGNELRLDENVLDAFKLHTNNRVESNSLQVKHQNGKRSRIVTIKVNWIKTKILLEDILPLYKVNLQEAKNQYLSLIKSTRTSPRKQLETKAFTETGLKETWNPQESTFQEDYIAFNRMLNFEISPRISRCGEKQIKVEEGNKQVTESMKWQMMLTAVDLGYRYSSKIKRKIIAEAVSKQVSYDHGFKVPVSERAF